MVETNPSRERALGETVIKFAGDPEVLRYSLERRDKGRVDDGRLLVFVLQPGGQRGVIEGGFAIAIEELGISQIPDVYATSSSGTPVAGYTLAGQAVLGTSIYFEDNIQNEFVKFSRIPKIMDLDRLKRVLDWDKPLQIDKLRLAKPQFLASIFDRKIGKIVYLDIKGRKDPVHDIIDSCRVPVLGGFDTLFRRQIDGAWACPRPIEYAVNVLGATDILIVTPAPFSSIDPRFPDMLMPFAGSLKRNLWRIPNGEMLRNLIFHDEVLNQEVKFVQTLMDERKVRVGIIYAQLPFSTFSMNGPALRQAAEAARAATHKFFAAVS